jgi:hypothetical protein
VFFQSLKSVARETKVFIHSFTYFPLYMCVIYMPAGHGDIQNTPLCMQHTPIAVKRMLEMGDQTLIGKDSKGYGNWRCEDCWQRN